MVIAIKVDRSEVTLDKEFEYITKLLVLHHRRVKDGKDLVGLIFLTVQA